MLVFCLFLYLTAGVTGQGFSTTFLQNALFGGDHSDFGVASHVDQNRGVRYIVGQTYSNAFSGLSPVDQSKSLGAPNILVVALNQQSDDLIWFNIVGTSRSDQPRALTVDSQGNIWITGQTYGSFDNEEGSNGAVRGFLIKMDSQGSVLSSTIIESCQPTSMAIDSLDNLFIVGSVINSKDQDSEPNEDAAIFVYSAISGEKILSQTFGGSASDIAKTVIVAGNTVAIGGATLSSDFPVTLGERVCEECSGAGFVITLEFNSDDLTQKYSAYVLGKNQESLSVVSITMDARNNLYLAIYDDANSMGSYIQQIKSDRTLGWTSEKSDSFWKVEYLPLIDAVYTIGTFSTPSDYATLYVLDLKTGSHVYSSKALTGSIVDASVYVTEDSSVKIYMVGSLSKDLRINNHGRSYGVAHRTDDVLLVSMVIKSLKKHAAHVDVIARSQEARAEDGVVVSQCLWYHVSGFSKFNDLTTDYTVVGTAIVLPYESGHNDYDLNHASSLIKAVPSTNAKAVRLSADAWGVTFDSHFVLGFQKQISGSKIPTGLTYVEYDVINADIAKLIVTNEGRDWKTDAVAWSFKLKIISTNEEITASFPLTVSASLSVWISYDANATADNIRIFGSLDGVKPSTPSIKYTASEAQNSNWTKSQNLLPSIHSGSTMETLLEKAYICGIKVVIKTVPVQLVVPAEITGATEFPAPGSGEVAYVAQVVIPGADTIEGTQTKFAFLKADGTPFATSSVYVYTTPYEFEPAFLKNKTGAGYFATAPVTGTGTLAGWVFPTNKKFIGGNKYFFYIASGLSASDNLATSDPALVGGKRDIESRDVDAPFLMYDPVTKKYKEKPIQLVYTAASKPTVKDPLTSIDPPAPAPVPGVPPPPSDDGSGKGDPWFVGYNGQKFEFDGRAGAVFNLYNDPWVNVNSLFGYANAKKHRGTVMHTIGVSIGEHNLFFDIANRENRKIFDVIIDGTSTRISSRVHHLTGCVDIQFNSKIILITTPRHSIRLTIQWGKNGHITENYFDIDIHHPEEDVTKIGGVLGQTAHENADDVDMVEEDFEVDSIFSFEKSKFYNLQSIDC